MMMCKPQIFCPFSIVQGKQRRFFPHASFTIVVLLKNHSYYVTALTRLQISCTSAEDVLQKGHSNKFPFDVVMHTTFILQDLDGKVDPKAIRPAEIYVTHQPRRRKAAAPNLTKEEFQNMVNN